MPGPERCPEASLGGGGSFHATSLSIHRCQGLSPLSSGVRLLRPGPSPMTKMPAQGPKALGTDVGPGHRGCSGGHGSGGHGFSPFPCSFSGHCVIMDFESSRNSGFLGGTLRSNRTSGFSSAPRSCLLRPPIAQGLSSAPALPSRARGLLHETLSAGWGPGSIDFI